MTKKNRAKRAAATADEALQEAQAAHQHIQDLGRRIVAAHDEARKATTWINATGHAKLSAIAAEMSKARAEAQEARAKWQEYAEGGPNRAKWMADVETRLKRLECPPDAPTQDEKCRDPRSEYGALMDRIRDLEREQRNTESALQRAELANRDLREWQQRTQEAKQAARDEHDATKAELRQVRGDLSDREDQLRQALHLLRFFVYDAAQDDDHQWDDDAEPEVQAAQKLMAQCREFFEQGCCDPDEDGQIDDDPVIVADVAAPAGRQSATIDLGATMTEHLQPGQREIWEARQQMDHDTITRLIQALADATRVEQTTAANAPEKDTTEQQELQDLNEAAWGLIANAHNGDFERAHPDWRKAAERWRDRWRDLLTRRLHQEMRDEPERAGEAKRRRFVEDDGQIEP